MGVLTNTEIANMFFAGETVPSPNTISTGRNTAILARIDSYLLSFMRLESLPTDTYGDFKECGYILYEQMLNGEFPDLPKYLEVILKRRYKSVPMAQHNVKDYDPE